MRKKILIASFFATILLLMPLNAVAGPDELTFPSKEKNNDASVIVVNELLPDELLFSAQQLALMKPDTISIEELIAQIQSLIELVLLYFGDFPEIVAICQQIMDILNSFEYETFCAFLRALGASLFILFLIVGEIIHDLGLSEVPFFILIELSIIFAFGIVAALLESICMDVSHYESNFLLSDLTSLNSLSKFDKSVLESIVKGSSSVSGCPCEK